MKRYSIVANFTKEEEYYTLKKRAFGLTTDVLEASMYSELSDAESIMNKLNDNYRKLFETDNNWSIKELNITVNEL